MQRYHQRYPSVTDVNEGLPSDVPADVVDDLDIFVKVPHREGDGESSFTAGDLWFIVTASTWILKTIPNSGSELADNVSG